MKRKKLIFGILSENRSMAAAMITRLAQDHGWDADIEFIPPQADVTLVQERIEETKPDLFALSFRSYERQQAFEVASAAKKTGVKILGGGCHPTMLPEDVVRSGFFDGIVTGDGMGVMCSILDNYRDLQNSRIIRGQMHQDKSVYLKYYFSESQKILLQNTRTVNMLTSIGCPFSCKYCGSSRMDFFMFPEVDLVNNMVDMARKFNIQIFTFQDDLLCSNLSRLRRISSLLEETLSEHGLSGQGIGFGRSVNARASSFDGDVAAELVRLGITDVSFGIESASTKLLRFLNKKQTSEDCYRAIDLCHKHGLFSRVNLMFGIPTQDREDYELSLQFIKEARPDIVNLFYFTPYPGTDLYDYCFDNGYFPDTFDRNRFDWFNPSLDGIRHIQCRLKTIDYDLATDYMERINSIYDTNDYIRPLLHAFDQHPWVLIGSSVQIYFSQILQHLKKYQKNNYLGYWDIDPDAAYSVAKRVEDRRYCLDTEKPPTCFVTYCHTTGRDYQNLKYIINDKFGDVPLVSISSMERHTVADVNRMISGDSIN